MKRSLFAILIISLLAFKLQAQELFTFSEPASNMPANSLGIRVNNWLMNDPEANKINYHMVPELMWGVNKNFMGHAEAFISNRDKGLSVEGAAFYGKYRFYSNDDVYRHFRIAAYGRVSANSAAIHQDEININGHNSGVEAGMIVTQLAHKQAFSATVGYVKAVPNASGNDFPASGATSGVNVFLSTGRLILPRKYNSYKQTNFNVMFEVIGQYQPKTEKYYFDVGPSLQFIFNSQARIDIAYRRSLLTNMDRTAPNGMFIRLEYLFFNPFK